MSQPKTPTLRLCSACIHQQVPKRPQPFAAHAVMSAGTTDSVNNFLEDEFNKRKIEEQRVAEGYPLDYKPRFFPWCRKLTLSAARVQAIQQALHNGTDGGAHEAHEAGRIVIDYANGNVLPVYVICARANPNGDCDQFERWSAL